ncbi:flagellar protein FlaG [Paraglaciecola marina]|uniref:flagellar protein FlaG n=1 Tax=Paraglaciecola marina TaxID=2500157 RepID=UPI00105DE74F|nr:flagellar protein FlaG [Paraglaciecola marina]
MEINSFQVGQSFALPKEDLVVDKTQTQLSQSELSAESNNQTKVPVFSADNQVAQDEYSPEKIEIAVTQISEFVQASSRQLNFSVDEDSNKQVVKVTDAESGDVIRQIPSEEVLKLSERLQDLQTEVGTAVGLLFNKQV